MLPLWLAPGHNCILTTEKPSAFIPGPSDFFLTGSSSLSSQSASLPPPANNEQTSECYTYRSAGVNAIQARKSCSYKAVVTGSSSTTMTESTFPFPKHSNEGTTLSVKVLVHGWPSLSHNLQWCFLLDRLLREIICWCKPRYFLSHSLATFSSLTFCWLTLISLSPAKDNLSRALWSSPASGPASGPPNLKELSGTFRMTQSSRVVLSPPHVFI